MIRFDDGICEVEIPGSGMSFAARRDILSVLLNYPNTEILVIDPELEYFQQENERSNERCKR